MFAAIGNISLRLKSTFSIQIFVKMLSKPLYFNQVTFVSSAVWVFLITIGPLLNTIYPFLKPIDPFLNTVDPFLQSIDPFLRSLDPFLQPIGSFSNIILIPP
jgi:hypothetical protein